MDERVLNWIRSSFCSNAGCAELARHDDHILFRSSLNPSAEPLVLSLDEARALVAGMKNGDFDQVLGL